MTDADLELLLYRILSGKVLFYYKNDQYELKSPSYNVRYQAQIIYHNIINDEKYNDWIREESLEYLLIGTGLWSKDTTKIIKDMEKKIDKDKVDMYLSAALKEKVKKIRNHLNELRGNLNSLLSKKGDMFSHTLEGYASSVKNEYIVCNTLFKDNIRVFSDNIINNQSSYIYFNDLVNEVNKQIIPIDRFKELARSGMWRSYWNCNKTNIFNKAVCDWTDDQRTLVSMSIMYDNIYDHPECPNDNIIEDDDMLDGWMIHQREKVQKAKKQAQVDDMNPKLKNAQEVFLMPQSTEELEEIIGLNSSDSLVRMKQKINYVKAAGETEEYNLPDVQLNLRNQMNEMVKNRK